MTILSIHCMIAAFNGTDVRCAGYATFGSSELAGPICRRVVCSSHRMPPCQSWDVGGGILCRACRVAGSGIGIDRLRSAGQLIQPGLSPTCWRGRLLQLQPIGSAMTMSTCACRSITLDRSGQPTFLSACSWGSAYAKRSLPTLGERSRCLRRLSMLPNGGGRPGKRLFNCLRLRRPG